MGRDGWFVFAGSAAVALVAGSLLPVQAGVNSQLARRLGHPGAAALVSFFIGTALLAAYCLVLRQPVSLAELRNAPPWMLTGGLFGAIFVAVAAALAPRLGATGLTALVIAGQLGLSLALDHYGWLGFPVRPVVPGRLLGAALLAAGVVLVLRPAA
jgi:transporter family-2 protein